MNLLHFVFCLFRPRDAYQPETSKSDQSFHSSVCVQEGEIVYDFAWYPLMNSISLLCIFLSLLHIVELVNHFVCFCLLQFLELVVLSHHHMDVQLIFGMLIVELFVHSLIVCFIHFL